MSGKYTVPASGPDIYRSFVFKANLPYYSMEFLTSASLKDILNTGDKPQKLLEALLAPSRVAEPKMTLEPAWVGGHRPRGRVASAALRS